MTTLSRPAWIFCLLASHALLTTGCGGSPADITPEGFRKDQDKDGTWILTFTGWKGKPEQYAEFLRKYDNVSKVQMANADVTDAVVVELKRLTGLRELNLSNTQVSDKGLTALVGLDQLTTLWLENTPVTDAALDTLGEMKSLNRLHLTGSKVHAEAAEKWKQAKPGRRYDL
jgi:hypothetical protein